jgi:hypothetical protein
MDPFSESYPFEIIFFDGVKILFDFLQIIYGRSNWQSLAYNIDKIYYG